MPSNDYQTPETLIVSGVLHPLILTRTVLPPPEISSCDHCLKKCYLGPSIEQPRAQLLSFSVGCKTQELNSSAKINEVKKPQFQ